LFCDSTEAALRAFQAAQGLAPTGVCDERTYAALVEASWVLGERVLSHASPNLRGDDVAELQIRLARLGFDAGKVDGIFGPNSAHALSEFQRNCGLAVDATCGAETVQLLDRLARQSGSGPGVATLRELELLRHAPRNLSDRRVVVGNLGSLGSIARLVARQLRMAGALVVPIDDRDPYVQAHTANQFGADVFIGLDTVPSDGSQTPSITYYAVPAFASVAGAALARRCADALVGRRVATTVDVVGRRLPILRETRMPAVLCTIGPLRSLLDRSPSVAASLTEALSAWVSEPI
jgi:N-acetylmuramoyl-L-alanine amidase